jgi:hypothetical protein
MYRYIPGVETPQKSWALSCPNVQMSILYCFTFENPKFTCDEIMNKQLVQEIETVNGTVLDKVDPDESHPC